MITCLKSSDGTEVFNHEAKAELLWHAYKERLGSSNPLHLPQNLEDLISLAENLDLLESPFTNEEIDAVVKRLSAHKAPGPDGFNNEFIMKCWPIIAPDFYALCEGFQKGGINLQSINGSFITLLPKVDSPTGVGDYRPISLLNCSMKIITKLLANRLQVVIMQLVHKNQYGLSKLGQFQIAWLRPLNICIYVNNPGMKSLS